MEWYLGDTTQSLGYLAASEVDVAFTYNEAAELAIIKSGAAVSRDLVFLVSVRGPPRAALLTMVKDHFYLVGPLSNPAKLLVSTDGVSDMFNKIVSSGNAHAVVRTSFAAGGVEV